MGLHLLVLAAKLKFLPFLSSSHSFTPIITSLLCPFVLKVSFSSRHVRGVYSEVVDASRLFLFQLGQIVTGNESDFNTYVSRWHRAVRLVYQRVTNTRRSPPDEESSQLHSLSMLTL